jgi:hypothetical protein
LILAMSRSLEVPLVDTQSYAHRVRIKRGRSKILSGEARVSPRLLRKAVPPHTRHCQARGETRISSSSRRRAPRIDDRRGGVVITWTDGYYWWQRDQVAGQPPVEREPGDPVPLGVVAVGGEPADEPIDDRAAGAVAQRGSGHQPGPPPGRGREPAAPRGPRARTASSPAVPPRAVDRYATAPARSVRRAACVPALWVPRPRALDHMYVNI